uniref:Reverse transcriptase/retrotransposon-derived protein RNase H-like domain-containing protein n=1 Tax=Moniliophthora roreri TaxID=221103 RepID=A0A0W0FW47_MONRR
MKRVLEQLQQKDLFLKMEEVIFLGLVIWPGHMVIDPVKLAGIKKWPRPEIVKGVRFFLDFGNFYWKFIEQYMDLVKPLTDLTKKEARFLKEPILKIPDLEKAFVIEADTSK